MTRLRPPLALSLLAALALAAPLLAAVPAAAQEPFQRPQPDRPQTLLMPAQDSAVDTSEAWSQLTFPASREDMPLYAAVVSADSPADIAAAAALVGYAQVLLTDPDELSPHVADRLAATPRLLETYVIGGTAAVSPAVEAELARFGPVERLAGPGRAGTADAIAREVFLHPLFSSALVTADAAQSPDIYPAVALLGGRVLPQGPVLYPGSALLEDPPRTDSDYRLVLGGTARISDEQFAAIKATARLAGLTRTATAAEVATSNLAGYINTATPPLSPRRDHLVVVNPYAPDWWADALGAASFAAVHGAALAYTEPDGSLPPVIEAMATDLARRPGSLLVCAAAATGCEGPTALTADLTPAAVVTAALHYGDPLARAFAPDLADAEFSGCSFTGSGVLDTPVPAGRCLLLATQPGGVATLAPIDPRGRSVRPMVTSGDDLLNPAEASPFGPGTEAVLIAFDERLEQVTPGSVTLLARTGEAFTPDLALLPTSALPPPDRLGALAALAIDVTAFGDGGLDLAYVSVAEGAVTDADGTPSLPLHFGGVTVSGARADNDGSAVTYEAAQPGPGAVTGWRFDGVQVPLPVVEEGSQPSGPVCIRSLPEITDGTGQLVPLEEFTCSLGRTSSPLDVVYVRFDEDFRQAPDGTPLPAFTR